MTSKVVVVVGGGFCGTVAAVYLMRARTQFPLRIVLIDPGEVGRGVAYGTRDVNHLLNVPIGGMSAFANDPDGFLRFAQSRKLDVSASGFLPRYFYGDYLQWLLRDALLSKLQLCDFSLVRDTVFDIDDIGSAPKIHLASGKVLAADWVFLTTGNEETLNPPVATHDFFERSKHYVRNPWAEQGLDALDAEQPVLLIGSGLTAVDVALSLRARNSNQPMHAISRHGLTPLAHRGLNTSTPGLQLVDGLMLGKEVKVSATFHALRHIVRSLVRDGGNWRDLFAALRPYIPTVWHEKMTDFERRRFLRHCEVYWDVHRHRLAPTVSASLQDLLLTKQL